MVDNDLKKTLETSNSNVQNKTYFTGSKIGRIKNNSLDLEKNLLSQKFYNKNIKNSSPINRIKNLNSFSISNIPKILNNNFTNTKLNDSNNIFKSQPNFFLSNINKNHNFGFSKNINSNELKNMYKSQNNFYLNSTNNAQKILSS